MTPRILFAIALSLLPVMAGAQAVIYESRDKSGPSFSDQPSPGARPLDLSPLNVIEGPGAPPPPAAAPDAAPTPYSQVSVVSPANGGTVWTNTGAFEMQASARPPLQTGRGDGFRVRIDGQVVPRTFSGAAISVSETDWARAEAADNVLHSLQVSIVDQGGAVLLESAPVQFYLRRHTIPLKERPQKK
jgi:hypothetical protein